MVNRSIQTQTGPKADLYISLKEIAPLSFYKACKKHPYKKILFIMFLTDWRCNKKSLQPRRAKLASSQCLFLFTYYNWFVCFFLKSIIVINMQFFTGLSPYCKVLHIIDRTSKTLHGQRHIYLTNKRRRENWIIIIVP